MVLNGGVYNPDDKTITWTENWNITSIEEQSKTIVKDIITKFNQNQFKQKTKF